MDKTSAQIDLRTLYLDCRKRCIAVDPHVAALAIRAAGDYASIRDRYHVGIVATITDYLSGATSMANAKYFLKPLAGTSFNDAFEAGWVETAGDTYEPDPEDVDWLATRLDQELAYIDSLFVTMKAMKSDTEEPLTLGDIDQFAEDRANGYCASLDGVNAQGKLRGKKSVMLTLDGPDGKESCATCQRYKGKSHRAKWWVSHDLVPGPGNETYECNGYNCQHQLFDADGNVWAGTQ